MLLVETRGVFFKSHGEFFETRGVFPETRDASSFQQQRYEIKQCKTIVTPNYFQIYFKC